MRILIADYETDEFKFDSNETYQIKERFLCVIDIESKEKWFFNIEKNGNQQIIDFLNSISNVSNPVRIYFHNANFDLAFLYKLLRKDCNYKIIKNNSMILQFKVYKQYKNKDAKSKKGFRIFRKTIIDIRNSYSILPTSLKKLGLSVGLPKLDIDYSGSITQEYIDYCFRDCEIVELALRQLVKNVKIMFDYDISILKLPLTAPSLSKRIFHHLIVKKWNNTIINKIYDKNRAFYTESLRPFYFGGRVEVYDFNQCLEGHYNDINSSYPNEMYNNLFPLAPFFKLKCGSQKQCWNEFKDNYHIFGAICEVVEHTKIPLVPVRMNDKILFPTGSKKAFLFRKEIEFLIQNKAKIKILYLYKCSGYLPLFKEYIDICYNKRKQYKSESFENLLLKLLMNSLYGKFAEKIEKESVEIINDLQSLDDNEIENCELIETDEGIMFIKRVKQQDNKLKINIFYAMMITALARLNLTKYILKSNRAYYTDSDSVVSSDLIHNSKELGQMKSEFQFSRFQAVGCKEYIYENKESIGFNLGIIPYIKPKELTVKMKGFGKIKANSFEGFIQDYRKGKKQHRPIGFFESFVREKPLNTILVYPKYKTHTYDKRWILKDLTTRPFNLERDDYNEMLENNERMIEKIISNYSKKECIQSSCTNVYINKELNKEINSL